MREPCSATGSLRSQRAIWPLDIGAWLPNRSLLLAVGRFVMSMTSRFKAALVVSVFPIPGDRVAAPQTQIAFRGAAASMLGGIRVVGSRSGVHVGRLETDSDGEGASFIPSIAF